MNNLSSSQHTVFLASTDLEKAKVYYQQALGLDLVEGNDQGLVFRLAEGELRLTKVPTFTPLPWTVLDWQVEDLRASLAGLLKNGVVIERFDGMDHDEDGIWSSPDGKAKIIWFKDPDGNVLSLSERE